MAICFKESGPGLGSKNTITVTGRRHGDAGAGAKRLFSLPASLHMLSEDSEIPNVQASATCGSLLLCIQAERTYDIWNVFGSAV